MKEPINPLLCDIDTGMCLVPGESDKKDSSGVAGSKRRLKIVYFTDPICSSCWGIEPQLRKLKLEYGETIEIEYRMGGLLPDWSYNSGGISKPSDVAHHWDEVSAYYDMPIDGDVWLEDPLSSSYPPSVAFKAAQMQDEKMSVLFLRIIREMVFLEKKNICNWTHLESAAARAGLDLPRFKADYEGPAVGLFRQDLSLAKQLGVRGFPTLFFIDADNKQEVMYGAKPYTEFEMKIKKLAPEVTAAVYEKSLPSLFSEYSSLTAKEFSVLSGIERKESERMLEALSLDGELVRFSTRNGAIWRKKEN